MRVFYENPLVVSYQLQEGFVKRTLLNRRLITEGFFWQKKSVLTTITAIKIRSNYQQACGTQGGHPPSRPEQAVFSLAVY